MKVRISRDVDTERGQQATPRIAITAKVRDVFRSTMRQQHLVTKPELVALGVAAEVVMIVEDQ